MKVWCLLRDQFAHVKPVEAAFGRAVEFVYDDEWDPSALVNASPDIVLCVNDYPFDIARCLDAAREQRIPSLDLQDGILEWRCQFENSLFGAGGGAPQHQPVLADKIACIGQQSLRQIAAWGNAAKVELTGMPRLDQLCSSRGVSQKSEGTRVLVMTAKNPGFTPAQRETTIRSLNDLKGYLDSQPQIQTLWRVSRGVADILGVRNQLSEVCTAELRTAVEQVDAVITTPSTAMLEAMLLHKPVAALDYHNVPSFFQTAWRISAPDHIHGVIRELLEPSVAKLAYQSEILADSLICDGCASHRVRRLMEKMVAVAKNSGRNDLCFPTDLLDQQNTYHFFQPKRSAELYPGHSVFEENNLESLRVRLARAASENARLKAENIDLKRQAEPGVQFKKGIRRLSQIVPLRSFFN
ncbi:MAG: hypothetical protein JWM68_3660 [Verrucomicrobiales bacterium]|nr:hypothetical protein [Verrucomicrobiales bacterium]